MNKDAGWKETFKQRWEERRQYYRNAEEIQRWFEGNFERIRSLFEDERIRDFVFEPIRKLMDLSRASTNDEIRSTITQVAIANAVLAGLPGKLGVGVYVCMALEAWMALRIANCVGLRIDNHTDLFKNIGAFAGVATTIGWLFAHLLRFAFSLLSAIPGMPATVAAELLVTNLTGVLFWVAFEELKEQGSFRVPARTLRRVYKTSTDLFKFQVSAIGEAFSPENLKEIGGRLRAWLTGDIIVPSDAEKRGEAFVVGGIAALLLGQHSKLEGPLGEVFLQSIRDRWSRELSEASVEEIAAYMDRYDSDQMIGVMSVIKGKMFEHLVALRENTDGDRWVAKLHDDESFPGSDVVFTDLESGERIEVSLKAVEESSIIETALMRYPDIPILTTSEMADDFSDVEMVAVTDISQSELTADANRYFEDMMTASSASASRIEAIMGAGAGTVALSTAKLWPYVVAHLRGHITREHLVDRFQQALGEAGVDLAIRLSMAAALGPIYVWYLLAKGVMQLAPDGKRKERKPETNKIMLVEFERKPNSPSI